MPNKVQSQGIFSEGKQVQAIENRRTLSARYTFRASYTYRAHRIHAPVHLIFLFSANKKARIKIKFI
jgi:hypothetical protein